MLDQIFDIVKNFGQESVVKNPAVPNEHNEEVMADATKTIASGFQNVLAGGGLSNIIDLFKNRNNASSGIGGSGGNNGLKMGGLLKNPIVTMMIGYFISKLISKYKMSPSAASGVAHNLIPGALSGLINKTQDPSHGDTTLDKLIGSLTGGQLQNGGGNRLQDMLGKFLGNNNATNTEPEDISDIENQVAEKAQTNLAGKESGGGIWDVIRGFINK